MEKERLIQMSESKLSYSKSTTKKTDIENNSFTYVAQKERPESSGLFFCATVIYQMVFKRQQSVI